MGVFYLVVVNENRPLEILETMQKRGFESKRVIYRRCGWEGLSVLSFRRM
jgi:hypothetical protein